MQTKDTRRPATSKSAAPASRPRRTNSSVSAAKPVKEAPKRRKVETKRRSATRQPTPDVVYTQPGPFNRTRFILSLLIVVAVVLALIFGMAIFFKVDVEKITVSGADKYSELEIVEASGIMDGENLLSISESRISSNIQAALPYVYKVRVGIKLPDTVKIEIEELDVAYAIESEDGSWWLMRSDSVLVEKVSSADAGQHTKILGVQVLAPEQGMQAQAMQPVIEDENGETIPVTVYASEQLAVAVSIAQFLEDNGVIGQAASIDVSNITDIQLWYGQQYQIMLGNNLELGYKIRAMKASIDQMGDYQSGVLDVSFTTWTDQVGYTPFS